MNVRVWQIDLEEKTAKNWYHPGGIPTEPFFVPRPGATEEDDGEFFNWRKIIFGNGRYSETATKLIASFNSYHVSSLREILTWKDHRLFAGVAISLVSDDNGGGFVLVLNGSDFTELARADLPYGLPYGLHGCWVPGQSPYKVWGVFHFKSCRSMDSTSKSSRTVDGR